MTDGEINQACAELFGWTDIKMCSCDEKRLRGVDPADGRKHHTPDFLHDETASAMLLEAMPLAVLERRQVLSVAQLWACFPHALRRDFFEVSKDRKIAIVQAFLKWKSEARP